MRQFPRTHTQSFLLVSAIIIAVVMGVGIPLGFTGTYEQPSWMPHGTGINIPSSRDNAFRPEMVIITSNAFKSTFEPLAEWKTQKGTPCIVKTTDDIYSQYSGRDDAEKIRNYLKAQYANGSLKWVLLGGDEGVVPLRFVFNDDTVHWGGTEKGGSNTLKPTDFYYSDLTGTWDTDGDGNFGESPSNMATHVDEVDWTPEVYVGRFPGNEQGKLENLVAKTLDYEKNPLNGTWMNDFLLGGAVANTETIPVNDEGLLVQNITASYVPSSIDVTLSLDSASNLTSFDSAFNLGKSLVHFQGHGDLTAIASAQIGSFFTTGDAYSLSNYKEPALMFAAACSTGAIDIASTDTLMEALLFRQYEGVIGYIGAYRVTWYFDYHDEDATNNRFNSLNRGMARYFWQSFFSGGLHQPGKAIADMKVTYLKSPWYTSGVGNIDNEYERKNLFTYTLWGDPELSVYTSQLGTFGNPLPTTVYAGQRLQPHIKYNNSIYDVPGATVCIQSGDFYYTSHATGGAFDVRLALDPRTYNVTITGPNMQPYNTTFTTVLDTTAPQVPYVEEVPPSPDWVAPRYNVNDAFTFALQATDAESGVGAVILHVSYDDFATYANFSLEKDLYTDRYSTTLYNFPPGALRFYFTVMNYAENATDVIPNFANYVYIDLLISHYSIMAVGIIAGAIMGLLIGLSLRRKWQIWKRLPADNGQDLIPSDRSENMNEKELDLA